MDLQPESMAIRGFQDPSNSARLKAIFFMKTSQKRGRPRSAYFWNQAFLQQRNILLAPNRDIQRAPGEHPERSNNIDRLSGAESAETIELL